MKLIFITIWNKLINQTQNRVKYIIKLLIHTFIYEKNLIEAIDKYLNHTREKIITLGFENSWEKL